MYDQSLGHNCGRNSDGMLVNQWNDEMKKGGLNDNAGTSALVNVNALGVTSTSHAALALNGCRSSISP